MDASECLYSMTTTRICDLLEVHARGSRAGSTKVALNHTALFAAHLAVELSLRLRTPPFDLMLADAGLRLVDDFVGDAHGGGRLGVHGSLRMSDFGAQAGAGAVDALLVVVVSRAVSVAGCIGGSDVSWLSARINSVLSGDGAEGHERREGSLGHAVGGLLRMRVWQLRLASGHAGLRPVVGQRRARAEVGGGGGVRGVRREVVLLHAADLADR